MTRMGTLTWIWLHLNEPGVQLGLGGVGELKFQVIRASIMQG